MKGDTTPPLNRKQRRVRWMVGSSAEGREVRRVSLRDFGRTPQAAVRVVLDQFRHRGWRDESGTAVQLVHALLEAEGPMSEREWARQIPSGFLHDNGVRRVEVSDYLLSSRSEKSSP